jgi:hypothetical protein
VTGTLAGLGQEGGTIELLAEGSAIVTCTNPGQGGEPAGNEPPGQQPLPISVGSGEEPIQGVSKSGNFTFNLTTNPPTQEQIEGACKENFTATLVDVEFTSYTIVVNRGGETTTLGPFTP